MGEYPEQAKAETGLIHGAEVQGSGLFWNYSVADDMAPMIGCTTHSCHVFPVFLFGFKVLGANTPSQLPPALGL